MAEQDPVVQELRRKVQAQLKESGMDTVIKKLVESICESKDDLMEINADDVLQTIYNRGLMESVLKFDTSTKKDNKVHLGDVQTSYKDRSTGWLENLKKDENINEMQGRKYYLKVEILGGKAFLDHLSQNDSILTGSNVGKLTLHLFFKSQRFKSRPVNCQCDPSFREEFVIDIGQFGGSVVKLLTVYEPLKILVIREDPNISSSGGVVTSFTLHDWRSVLLSDNGFQSFHLELFGIGPESHLPVGLLHLRTTILPCPDEQIKESTFLEHLQSEKSAYEGSTRFFVLFAKKWTHDFLSIRPCHSFRIVRLFAYDEQMISRPVVTFVQSPLNTDRSFQTPFHAAWFVSLLSSSPTQNNAMQSLQSLETTITSKNGTLDDLAILLCSLLIGFGLNSFVAFGIDNQKGTLASWVVTFSNSLLQPTFWDPVTGKRETIQSSIQPMPPNRAEKITFSQFLDIGCVFNDEMFYSNIQNSTSVQSVDWNLSNPKKWKNLSPKIIAKLHKVSFPLLILPSTLDCELLAFNIEVQIQEMIQETRIRQGQSTRWDGTTSKFMGQQLATYELKASTGGSNFENFFEDVIMRSIPEGYDFKGYHYHSRSTNAKDLFHLCMRDVLCQQVVNCRGEDVQMALRVSLFPYPENLTSLRLMIGCKFLSLDM